jgi:hypothetical protein
MDSVVVGAATALLPSDSGKDKPGPQPAEPSVDR